MKKTIAILLSLLMLLSCVSGLAETQQMVLRVDINDALLADLPALDDAEANAEAKLTAALLTLVEKAVLSVNVSETAGTVLIGLDDGNGSVAPVLSLAGAMEGEDIYLVSSLFPSYAIKLDMDNIYTTLGVTTTVNDESVDPEAFFSSIESVLGDEELMGAIMLDVMGYVGDIAAVLENMVSEQEGNVTSYYITSNDINAMAAAVLTRAFSDELLAPVMQMLLDEISAQAGVTLTAEDVLPMLLAEFEAAPAEENQLLAVVSTYESEGDNAIALSTDTLYVTVEVMESGEDAAISLDIVTDTMAQYSGDWNAAVTAIASGSNLSDIYFHIESASMGGTVGAAAYLYTAGDVFKSTCSLVPNENGVEMALTVDPAMGMDIVTVYMSCTETEATAEGIDLSSLTVVNIEDLADESSEAYQAVMADIQNNIFTLIGAIGNVAPEAMTVLINSLMGE